MHLSSQMILHISAAHFFICLCVYVRVCVFVNATIHFMLFSEHFSAGAQNFKCCFEGWSLVNCGGQGFFKALGTSSCPHNSPPKYRSTDLCVCLFERQGQGLKALIAADSQTGEWSPQDSVNPMRLISSDATLSAAEVANYKDLIIHPSSLNCYTFFPCLCLSFFNKIFITDKKWQEFVQEF